MTAEFIRNYSRISIRILVACLGIQQFRLLLNSSRVRLPQNSYKYPRIKIKFYSNQKFRWPRNSESVLIRILFKMTTEFFWNSSRISIRILVASLIIQPFKWLLISWRIRWPRNSCEIPQGFDQNSLQKLDDYGIFMKFFKDFDQNSGGQP